MMYFPQEHETVVHAVGQRFISITQPDPYGGDDDVVHLSTDRARKVAAELLRLVDELEGYGK